MAPELARRPDAELGRGARYDLAVPARLQLCVGRGWVLPCGMGAPCGPPSWRALGLRGGVLAAPCRASPVLGRRRPPLGALHVGLVLRMAC